MGRRWHSASFASEKKMLLVHAMIFSVLEKVFAQVKEFRQSLRRSCIASELLHFPSPLDIAIVSRAVVPSKRWCSKDIATHLDEKYWRIRILLCMESERVGSVRGNLKTFRHHCSDPV